jgi:endoribonuclease Dicer
MRRIDDMLLVTELNATLFDHSIHESQLHAAVSAPSACAEFDYERLELLGDAYLKYLSSIYLFVTNPSQHEGALHSARLRIISNRALFFNAENVGLAPYIQAKPLVPKQWCPPNFTVIPPPPSKVQENESATRVDKGGAEREVGTDVSEIQDVKQEEKYRMSPGLSSRAGLGTSEPDAHQVAADSQESTAYRGFSVEPGPHQGDVDKTPINDATKPYTEKSSSKKSKKDDQNVQWLGDKVNKCPCNALDVASFNVCRQSRMSRKRLSERHISQGGTKRPSTHPRPYASPCRALTNGPILRARRWPHLPT